MMERYWFGPPDAASAELDLDTLAELYLNIDGTLNGGRDQAMPRVLFGRKGSRQESLSPRAKRFEGRRSVCARIRAEHQPAPE